MNEEEKIKEQYTQYQLSTQGIDIWEEDAFRAGWLASKNFFKPDVIESVCECKEQKQVSHHECCGDECINIKNIEH